MSNASNLTATIVTPSQVEARYLSPLQLSLRWNGAVTTGTLANWRSKGRGPSFTKLGKTVRYPMAEVLAYEAANTNVAAKGVA